MKQRINNLITANITAKRSPPITAKIVFGGNNALQFKYLITAKINHRQAKNGGNNLLYFNDLITAKTYSLKGEINLPP